MMEVHQVLKSVVVECFYRIRARLAFRKEFRGCGAARHLRSLIGSSITHSKAMNIPSMLSFIGRQVVF